MAEKLELIFTSEFIMLRGFFLVWIIVCPSSRFCHIDFSCWAVNFHFKLVIISKILITVDDLNGRSLEGFQRKGVKPDF